jgi:hypothetical protein
MGAIAVLLLLLVPGPAHSQAADTRVKVVKPDLHGGGANPSSIPNDATTEVTLPGFHLAGAHLETDHLCKVVSYKVVSDNEIKMKVEGTRTVGDQDDRCAIIVTTPGGTTSTWIVVELTEAQQQEQEARQKAAGMAKAQAFQNRAGKTWHLRFADGATQMYTATGPDADGMPGFQSSEGIAAKITVTNDNTVTIIQADCVRSGKVVGTQVKDGQSMGECSPVGSWTATVGR